MALGFTPGALSTSPIVVAHAGGRLTTTEERGQQRLRSWNESRMGQRVMGVLAPGIPALLYLLYVSHYSINVPIADDWNVLPLASIAIHHHLTLSELWGQYGDTRLFVGYVFFAAFALFDHLNEKAIILFSAATLIASFVLLLVMFRSYLRRRLTFLPVFALGIVWFSIADVENALWSFQFAWYFVVFFFVVTAYFLGIRHHYRNLFFALGIVAAILASLAEVQGFVVWPVGLICLLWVRPWGRRTSCESAIWALSAVATAVFYLRGFNFGVDTAICVVEGGRKGSCSLTFGLLHPVQLVRFSLVLVGNVIPTLQGQYVVVHELLGAAICITACFVIVQTIRERRIRTDPLPLLLIVFGLLFDLMLALSRMGEGVQAAGLNRYTMPNVILLAGILIFVCAHVPRFPRRSKPIDLHREAQGFWVCRSGYAPRCPVHRGDGVWHSQWACHEVRERECRSCSRQP